MNYEKKLKEVLVDENTDYEVVKWIEQTFPELKESEDEIVRKWIIDYLNNRILNSSILDEKESCKKALAWLEKQGEHQKFRDSIQVGDKVTRNKDGILVNLSQLNRVAKKDNKQGEQKPTWSEEDEVNQINAIKYLELFDAQGIHGDVVAPCINWLKNRVQLQPRREWSKDDEEIVEVLNDYVKNLDIFFSEIKIGDKNIASKEFREKIQHWIKTLRPQNTISKVLESLLLLVLMIVLILPNISLNLVCR